MNTTPQRLGKYELQKLLGRGSSGEVWQSYDRQAHVNVAIKLLHPDLLQTDPHFMTSFMSDWQPLIALQHPHIVKIHEVNIARPSAGTGGTTPYIVMDYIESHTTLANYLQRTSHANNFPPVNDIISLFTRLASAVDYAHAQQIVHGNITSTNILLNTANTQHLTCGEPLLSDFGMASLPGNKNSLSPFYLAPEQVKGQTATPSSDIYALGVLLYEICTGVLPFHSDSPVAIMMHHLNTLPTPPMLINQHIPPALSEVILRAMAKDPRTRFSTASSLAEALAEACATGQTAQLNLNKTPVKTGELHAYPTSGPLVSPSAHPQPALPFAPILGVAQPYAEASDPYTMVTGQNRQESSLITTQRMTAPRLNTPTSQPLSHSQPSGKLPATTTSSMKAVTPPSTLSPTQTARFHASNFLSPLPTMIIFLLLLLVVVGALASSMLLRPAPPNTSSPVVGHVFFQDDALGHNDRLRLELHNIPAAPQGQRYYAWYQNASGTAFPLGPLTLANGTATLLYTGDSHHSNLLAVVRAVFITHENGMPVRPTSNAKVYQASFATASLAYIQHVLYMKPGFPAHNSLITGLFETIKGMNDKAGSIVDSLQGTHDYALARRQAIRIIEMLDGTSYAQSSGDLPAHLPSLASVPVGLLSSPTQPGYLAALQTEIGKIQQTAGNNTALRQHAQNVSNALTDLQDWLQQMRTYDLQLLAAPDLSTSSVLAPALQLQQFAQDAYTGRTIPPNQSPQPLPGSAGAYQALIEAQYMATLDLEKV